MRGLSQIFFLFFVVSLSAQEFFVSGNARVDITEGANLEVGGNLENNGLISNNGTLTLNGDWAINNMFLGMAGDLTFNGRNQTIGTNDLQTSGLTINSSGVVSYLGDQFNVMSSIDFQNGILVTADPTIFTLMPNAQVSGGSEDSHFQGRFSYQGGGDLTFPVGYQGQYAPLTILNVSGVDSEYTVFYQNPNPQMPIPGEDLLGVSHLGLWEVELTNGSVSTETPFFINFSNENLLDFLSPNEIRHTFKSPVIAYAPAVDSSFSSLGVETLLNTDSVTFGQITSEIGVSPTLMQPFYLAMGLAPRINPEGLVYIPEVFSPNAIDVDNQSFRIFGEKIKDENFLLEIYNNFGVIVYSTESFIEANMNGWDGTDQKTKLEQPPNTYYYYVRLEKENGETFNEKGVVLLIR